MPREYATVRDVLTWSYRSARWAREQGGMRVEGVINGRVNVDMQDIPMYHPCAMNIRSAKEKTSTAVPIHRYVVKGVDLSR